MELDARAAAHPRRWLILGALCLSLFVVGLDLTVLSVALPVLVRDLHATTDQLQWIVDAYTITFAGALLPAGSMGDRFGRKRVLLIGLAVFLVGSLLCAFAWSAGSLIVFRALLGLGGAIITPLTLGVLPIIFEERERPRAIAVWTVVSAISIPLGPIIGGWLLDHYAWGSVFLFNIPFVAAALAAVMLLVPETRDPRARRVDAIGAILATSGLALLVYGIIEQPTRGWDWVSAGGIAAGALLLLGYGLWEWRNPEPMLDVRLFSQRRFTWPVIAFGLVGFVLMGAIFLLTQYLQDVLGFRPFDAGLRIIPLAAGVLVGGPAGTLLVPRVGTKVTLGSGLSVLALALWLFASATVATGYGFIALCLSLEGLGLGLSMTPAINAILGALPQGEFGVGSAVSNAMRQVGGSIGVALLGNLYLNRYVSELHLPPQLPAAAVATIQQSIGAADLVAAQLPEPLRSAVVATSHAAFMSGMSAAMTVSAVVALAAAVLMFLFVPNRIVDRTARAVDPRLGLLVVGIAYLEAERRGPVPREVTERLESLLRHRETGMVPSTPAQEAAAPPAPGAGAAIVVRDVSVMLGHHRALDHVSAELRPGRVIGLIGPSGAGKTTLMRGIVGRQRLSGGDITVLGLPAGSARLRSEISYMTQDLSIYTDLTAAENVRYFATMFGIPAEEMDAVVAGALRTVDMSHLAGHLASRLSGGERQRVSLAVALIGRPRLMVLDEPTVGVDPVLREELWGLFRRLAASGTTLLVSSHVMDEAERCDDLLLLRDGQLLAHASPAELCRRTGQASVGEGFLRLVSGAR